MKGRGVPWVTDMDAGSEPAGILLSSESRSTGYFPVSETESSFPQCLSVVVLQGHFSCAHQSLGVRVQVVKPQRSWQAWRL